MMVTLPCKSYDIIITMVTSHMVIVEFGRRFYNNIIPYGIYILNLKNNLG